MSSHSISWFRVEGIPHGPVQFAIPLFGSSWDDVKAHPGDFMRPNVPVPPAQAYDFRATAPLELDRAGVCCTSGHFLWSCFLPWGFILPGCLLKYRVAWQEHSFGVPQSRRPGHPMSSHSIS